jgi:hypothetical protein
MRAVPHTLTEAVFAGEGDRCRVATSNGPAWSAPFRTC